MPLIIDDDSPALDTGRLTFRERLRTGRAVPIVSNRAIYDRLLDGYEPFLAGYARYIRYPLPLGQPARPARRRQVRRHPRAAGFLRDLRASRPS